jgi:hypothetical protein
VYQGLLNQETRKEFCIQQKIIIFHPEHTSTKELTESVLFEASVSVLRDLFSLRYFHAEQ